MQTASGKIYRGCNIEVSSFGLTICAERVAMFKALSEGESQFETIAVAADTKDFCPPCGACRQVINEFGPAARVISVCDTDDRIDAPLTELLPRAFGPTNLR